MTRYVIDAPTLLHLVAERVDVHRDHQLVAPNIIRSQALTLLLVGVRDGDLDEAVALEHHERCTALKIRLLGDRVSRRPRGGSRGSRTGRRRSMRSTSR